MGYKRGVTSVFSLVLFLMLSLTVSAYSEKIFDGTLFSGTAVDIDDYTVIFTLNYQENRVFADAGDDYASINLGSCDTLNNIKVCFNETVFDDDELKTYMDLIIYKRKPVISITRTVSDLDFYAGEEQTMTLEVKNTGDPATDATYYENLGEKFEILYVDEGSCSVERNAIIWKGYLSESRPLICKYVFKAKETIERSIVGSFTYEDGYKEITKYSTELLMKVKPIVTIGRRTVVEDEEPEENIFNWDLIDSKPTIGEKLRLAFNLTNKIPEKKWVDVDFKISYPASMHYEGPSYIRYETTTGEQKKISSTVTMTEKQDNVLQWEGRLRNNLNVENSETLVLEFITRKSGMNNILITANYKDEDGNKYNTTEYIKLEVENRGIRPILYIVDPDKTFINDEYIDSEETTELESLNKYKLRLQLDNSNAYSNMKDIKVKVHTDIINFTERTISFMEASGSTISHSFEFEVPRTDTAQNHKMNLTIFAVTEYGEHIYNETEYDFQINPFEDVKINHEFDKTSITGDEESRVVVILKNNRLVNLNNVNVEDIFDSMLIIDGVHSRTLNLKAEEEVEIYSYLLSARGINETIQADITTKVNYYDPDYDQDFEHIKTSTIDVEPKELDLTITRTIEDGDFGAGSIANIEYKVVNSEEKEEARNIILKLPSSIEYDIIGSDEYVIDKLEPGETINLEDKHKIRLKRNKDAKIPPTEIIYYDVEGHRMYEKTGESTITVQEDDYTNHVTGPLIFVERLQPEFSYAKHPTLITLRVMNEGDEPTDVTVTETGEDHTLSIPANSERLIVYSKVISENGTHNISEAEVGYGYQGITFKTLAQGSSFLVTEKPVEFVEIEPEEIIEEVEEPVIEEVEVIDEAESRKISAQFILEVFLILIVLSVAIAYVVYKIKSGPAPPVLEE